MPVTVHPSPLDQSPYQPYYRYAKAGELKGPDSTDALFKKCVRRQVANSVGEILQSSFDTVLPSARNPALKLEKPNETLFASSHSFVKTAITAYSNHNHLIIRPDDVWMSILCQFNLWVNANSEKVRHMFVAHKGKKELKIMFPTANRHTVDFGVFAKTMSYLIQDNVVDPELREWAIPDFSTTEDNDRIVSSVILMATLKKYFDYKCYSMCGLPAVTLLGEKEDWEKMYEKVDKLKSFGPQMADWCNLLKPVLRHFVLTFTTPRSDEVIDFWQRIAHYHGGGSGPTYLTGWITAFCFFNEEGESLYHDKKTGKGPTESQVGRNTFGRDTSAVLYLDGVLFPQIESDDIPPGYAEVDVLLDDNGQEFKCKMVAGMLGLKLGDSGIKSVPTTIKVIHMPDFAGTRPLVTRPKRESFGQRVSRWIGVGGTSITSPPGSGANITPVPDTSGNQVDGDGNPLKPGERIIDKEVGTHHDGTKDVVQPVPGWFIFTVDEKKVEEASVDPMEEFWAYANKRNDDLQALDLSDPYDDEDPDL